MKKMILNLTLAIIFMIGSVPANASNEGATSPDHEMQHGFILSDNDRYASHLVANGHHSRQVEISGELMIENSHEKSFYLHQKTGNIPERRTYFVFQAQNLDLPSVKVGQVLFGHIIESKLGEYEPQNRVVRKATFEINAIHINIVNPFFNASITAE